MNKYIVAICCMLIIINNNVTAQCTCSAGSGSSSFNDNMLLASYTQQYKWRITLGSTTNWFTPIVMAHSVNGLTHHHEMEGINLASTQSLAIAYKVAQLNEWSINLPYTLVTTNKSNSYNGLNDVQLWYNRLMQLHNLQLKLGLGVELPANLTPTVVGSQVVLSSASTDPMASISASYMSNKWLVKLNTMAKYTTYNTQDYNLGSYSTQSIMLGYKFNKNTNYNLPIDSVKTKTNWLALAGVNNDYFSKQKLLNTTVANTGGNMLLGNIGISMLRNYYSLSIQGVYPLYQKWTGNQQRIAKSIKLTLSINF